VAKWIIENAEAIGEAIAKGICSYFGKTYVEPKPAKTYKVVLGEYKTKEEAEAALAMVQLALEAARKQLVTGQTLLASAVVE
jgi:hypothetical protein